MNVLSLFNGMSTGHTALDNVGIKVDKYYSSEIKPAAIKLTQHHYPDTIQLGDINNWEDWDIDWASIDMVLSGSPCQDLSIAGKRKGLEGEKSSLFWVFVEIFRTIQKINPYVLFLQENVGSAPKSDVGIMSRALGVYPVRINSKLVTAQMRDRYYWSNIRTTVDGLFGDLVTDIPQPKDRKIKFKDIITKGYTDRKKARPILESEERPLKDKKKLLKRYKDFGMINIVFEKEEFIFKYINKNGYKSLKKNSIINLKKNKEYRRIYDDKSTALLEANDPLYVNDNLELRILNQIELERLQGFPDGWTSILTRNRAASLLGDGWTLPIIEHIFSFIKR